MIPMILLLSSALAGGPEDVRTELGTDVMMNWTQLTVEASALARGGGTESSQALEELAHRDANAAIRLAVPRLAVTGSRTVADLQSVPEFGPALNSRLTLWNTSEARYFASGRVEITAELSVQAFLKPFTLATAKPKPPAAAQPKYTGLIIDCRGQSLTPSWAPQVTSSAGDVLFESGVWEENAVDLAPVIFVSDPAHPAAARAGESPVFLSCGDTDGTRILLTEADSLRFRTSLVDAHILGEGKIVVVVDS